MRVPSQIFSPANKTMTITKDRGGSRDSQFQIWRLSSISESKKLSINVSGIRQKSPIRLTDADLLQDEIMFPTTSLPRRTRSLSLSLKQTRILTTLLPNAIVNISDVNKDNMDTFVGVLLFADVSGFTALCEKYNGFGKSGSEKLTATLNNYLGAMVEVIYKHGGDVLKFSGDALLALWKLENNEYIYSLIHRVICCALYIQNSIGIYETDVKVLLKVKLAISAGNITFSVIGNDESRHYLVVGQPVYEVKLAEQVCTSGEVVLSFSAWGHLSPVNYEHYWKDREHVKIIRIIYNPESSKREILRSEMKGGYYKVESRNLNGSSKETTRKKLVTSSSNVEIRDFAEDKDIKKLSSDLRTFLIPSVIQQIDADLPVEYLCEMRNVTVMFVNIIPNRLHTRKLISMVDKAYVIICSLAYKAMGSVNKVSLFDKDVMVLVIFGLRGFNHEGEVAACLKCGYDIRQACCSLDGVFCVSVGVTTGQAYCGVVGHPLRREYTVIGAVVNKAARIMCAYPGKVTCDRDTFLFSNLAASFFTIQEKRYLKGIEDTGPIYEFTLEKSKNTLAAMREGMYPILGREQEIQTFNNILQFISTSKSWEKAILVRGPGRIGKTRLLDEMILEAHKKGFVPVVIALHTVHSTLAYGTAQSIIKQILEIPDSATVKEKEERLSVVLKNHVPPNDYWYLNEVMNVKFPPNEKEDALIDSAGKFEKIKKLFHTILTMGTKSVIFAIDDVDYCDELSWKLIMSVIENRIKFLIMTMSKRLRPGTAKFLKIPPETDPHILKLTLSGLPNNLLASLACQVLNAKAIPVELERILIARSNGNPGWCESFLVSLTQSNILKVEELPEWYIKNLGLIIPPESDLKRTQYAASSNQFDSNVENNILQELTENQEPISQEEKIQYQEQKLMHRMKLVKFSNEKDELTGNSKDENPDIYVSHIEEAYEDLRQRIQLVRSQSRPLIIPSFAETLDPNSFEEASTSQEEDFEKKELKQDIELEIFKDQIETSSSSQSITSDVSSPVTHIADETFDIAKTEVAETTESPKTDSERSLKAKVSKIRRRLSSKLHSSAARYFTGSSYFQDDLVLKSLVDLREEIELPPLTKSKSAEPLPHRKQMLTADADISNRNDISSLSNEKSEYSPSSLWKSHTQELIDESIKIFIRGKTKSEKLKALAKGLFGKKHEHSDTVSGADIDTTPSQTCTRSPAESPECFAVRTSQRSLGFQNDDEPLKSEETESNINAKKRDSLQNSSNRIAYANPREGKYFAIDRLLIRTAEETHVSCSSCLSLKDSCIASNIFDIKEKKSSGVLGYKTRNSRKNWMAKLIKWMGKRSYASSSLSDSYVELPAEAEGSNNLLPVVLINPRINIDQVVTPECFVDVIMSVFDCLRPYEQLMLKCGSIIGEKFTRTMLNAIMHNPNPVLTAEAVKRLFEMQILCCGSDTSEYEYDREHVGSCRCLCTLANDDIADETLPRYSFCRVLVFKYSMFRSTLYELIPLDQKREFHIRAVEFLENEQVYCSACEMNFKTDRRFSKSVFSFADSRPTLEDIQFERLSGSLPTRISQRMLSIFNASAFGGGKSEPDKKNEWPSLLLPNILPDFQKCECLVLEADNLKQLINHCVAAELKKKEIEFVINYSALMITLGEFGEASKLLSEVELSVKSPEGNTVSKKKERRFFLGKIHLLLGQLNLELGALKKANAYLISALKYFGSDYIPLYFLTPLQYLDEYLTQVLYQNYPRMSRLKAKSGSFQDCRAMCLSLLSNVFMLQDRWKMARLAALRSLNFLRKNNDNFIELCNAYSNTIDIYRHFGNFQFCRKLEVSAAKSCITLFTYKTALELIAVGRLNGSILNTRLISGHLFASGKLGESAVRISHSISSHKVESYTISQVAQTMMMIGQLNKAAKLIHLLPTQDIWHYILSLEFILETGFVIESSDACLDAIWSVLNSGRTIDQEIERRAISTVYVWMSRLGKYEEAEMWSSKLPTHLSIPLSGDTVNNMMTFLKVLEGDLLVLTSLNDQEVKNNGLNKKVIAVMKGLLKSTKKTEIMLPRFLHLRAFYQYQMNNLSKALLTLAEAKKISTIHGNILERSWIAHSKMVWTNKCDFNQDFWTESASEGKLMKWTDNHNLLNWKNYMYSLKCAKLSDNIPYNENL